MKAFVRAILGKVGLERSTGFPGRFPIPNGLMRQPVESPWSLGYEEAPGPFALTP